MRRLGALFDGSDPTVCLREPSIAGCFRCSMTIRQAQRGWGLP